MKRERKKRLLVEFGFTAREIQVVEELAAKNDLNATQLLRSALRLYQSRDAGYILCRPSNDPVGCPGLE